ncbi:CDP-alcohol phosphatidyltransferase family protein [candidate division KSB1 bacterium]|nr:CDP-alcohol phosphatidyltransferase family protein [candidate division KSB1 bacterium]
MRFNKKEIFYISNILTSSRIFLAIPIAFLIRSNTQRGNCILVLLAMVAVLTDYFDGYFSRKFNQESDLGKILDPIADKILIIITLSLLAYYRNFPLSLIVIHLIRDSWIILISTIILKKTKKIVKPNLWGKLNTFIVSLTIIFFLLDINNAFFTIFFWLNYITMFFSTLMYYLFGESVLCQKQGQKYVSRFAAVAIAICGIYFGMQITFDSHPVTVKAPIDQSIVKMLVEKYAPVMYLHRDEKYRPVNVECVLDNSILLKNRYLLFFNPVISDIPDIFTLGRYTSTDYYLKYKRNFFASIYNQYKNSFHDCKTTVYATAFKLNCAGRMTYIIQYWFLFWASSGFMPRITWHEMDWEMVMFACDENAQLIQAGYSQNYYGQVLLPKELQYIDHHPVVFISLNDHNMYAQPGTFRSYLDKNKRFQLGKNKCSGDIYIHYDEYDLVILDEEPEWIQYRGYWGIPVTTWLQGPKYRNPKNKNLSMWKNPVGWFKKYQD